MISIQLANGTLDVNEGEEVALNHTAWRFTECPEDEWSNDFDIPKTRHNLQVLGASGLLYSPNQRYGNEIKPCTLNVSGRMFDARLQVVSVGKDTISICLYVNNVPDAIKGVTLRDLFQDDSSTIIPWYKDSQLAYPAWFGAYDYGMPYRTYYAQRHPVKSVAAILREIATRTGIQMPTLDKEYFLMSQYKRVGPNVRHQTVRCQFNTDDGGFKYKGSKHITNDLSQSESDSIQFNRKCKVHARITVSWKSNNNSIGACGFYVGEKYSPIWMYITPTAADKYMQFLECDINIEEPMELVFTLTGQPNEFDWFYVLADFYITDYYITDDDWDEELEYDWQYANDYILTPDIVSRNGDYVTFRYRKRGTADHYEQTVWYPKLLSSYFAYWSNVENCKITDLLFHLAYAEGKKLRFDRFNNAVEFVPNDDYTMLTDVNITEVRPSSDRFGQKNYILYQNAEMDNSNPITEIENIWLEEQKTVWQSKIFKQKELGTTVQIAQYSNPEYDSDNKEYKCDYDEVEGIGLLKGEYDSNGKLTLKYVELPSNGFEQITSVMEVDITDYGSYRDDTDYIYIDGVKYMVIEVQRNITDRTINEIKAIEIPSGLWA